MNQRSDVALQSLGGVAERHRDQMIAGMRWTLWLSVLSAPCGYITTVLLARVGPQVIGTYGILVLYIGLTSVFLFFGGNGVAIKFLPELPQEKRLSFLLSYGLVILAATLPYQIAASVWPEGLKYVFGREVSNWFGLLLTWLAPICIFSSLALAALKGLLEIKWSQVYSRVVTLGTFALYAVLYIGARSLLVAQYKTTIWSTFGFFTLVVTALAVRRLLRHLPWPEDHNSLRFFLPWGFWPYTWGLQASSVLNFLSTRLDYIFILNAGGLIEFGKYVTLITLTSVIPTFATFVLDSLLPSLTHTLALRDYIASRQITEVYLRFMLPCGLVAAAFAMLFVYPLFRILGSRYTDLVSLALVAFPVATLQVLNWFIGTMFTAIGLPHRDATVKAVRTVIFCAAFWSLWSSFHLRGAIWAWGIAEISYQLLGIYFLLRKMPFKFSFVTTYAAYLAAVCLAAVASTLLGSHRPIGSALTWAALVGGFFLGARYTWAEIRGLARLVLPSRLVAFTGV
ncbi:MAG: lipopolysaccharide biosynthesis protein [Candidatus Acidiferrales bacterium]